jgi:hypothetical protein
MSSTTQQVLKDLAEYQIPQNALALASGIAGATLSQWLRGVNGLPPATVERIEETLHAMMNLTHYRCDLPIAWSRVAEFLPLIERYRKEYVEHKFQTRAASAK